MISLIVAPLSMVLPYPARGSTRFFLDTASTAEYDSLLPLGMFHGVTSNPTILERDGVECSVQSLHALADQAFAHGVEEFMCQAWGGTVDTYEETGLLLAAKDPKRMVIKVPVNDAGVKAASKLQAQGIRICLTACYASHQALVAGSAGVEYIAPYLGRMTDAGKDGMAEIERMQAIVEGLGCDTRKLRLCLEPSALNLFSIPPHAFSRRIPASHAANAQGCWSRPSGMRTRWRRWLPKGVTPSPSVLSWLACSSKSRSRTLRLWSLSKPLLPAANRDNRTELCESKCPRAWNPSHCLVKLLQAKPRTFPPPTGDGTRTPPPPRPRRISGWLCLNLTPQ